MKAELRSSDDRIRELRTTGLRSWEIAARLALAIPIGPSAIGWAMEGAR